LTINATDFIIAELGGLWGQAVLGDISRTLRLYDFYDGKGQDWPAPSGLDYKPTKKRVNLVKKLIKREAGFMFGRSPEINLRTAGDQNSIAEAQTLLGGILEDSRFQNKLLQAARDCFIGKRVALKLSGGYDRPLRVTFRPSFEFVYSTAEDDCDRLEKIIFFYRTNDESERPRQRVWKQKYVMRGGRCFLCEGIYDGAGRLLEGGGEVDTGLDFIPCFVILNEGLSGDLLGESDVEELIDLQNAYNRLNSDDADALRFNMFPQTVAVDAKAESLQNMVLSPGALVDLQTDPAVMGDSQSRQAKLQKLESGFGYSERFEAAVNRAKNDMFDLLSVPNVSLEQLKGLMQSGKSMRALYWELISRCEEKWASWEPALIWMAKSLLKMAAVYHGAEIPEGISVQVEHLYPIIEDDFTEMANDRQEVAAGLRSRESYMVKWAIAPDAAAELEKIRREGEKQQ
jgi:Phage portal protein, SPP1 Gp6-like.